MDNVTHTLFALTLARTPLGRGGRGTAAALVIASNAPDADILAALGGSATYLQWHRGPTHGSLGVIGLGLVTAALVWSVGRLRKGGPNAPFGALLAASLVGVVAHILMDLATSYGTRLLSPFSWRWFAMDLMPIIDVYLWAILATGLLIGSRSREARRWSAIVALALMATNYGVRVAGHQEALARASRLYGQTLPAPCERQAGFGSLLDSWPQPGAPRDQRERCLVDTAALPTFFSPFAWRVIVQLPDAYLIDEGDAAWVGNQWTPLVGRAASTPAVQALLGFSRFPLARVFAEPSGITTVQFTDVRFATGLDDPDVQGRRSALFTTTVVFSPKGDLLDRAGRAAPVLP